MEKSMEYIGTVIRPPSEADSILLQAVFGCPHNTCAFCGAYRDKPYGLKDEAALLADLDFAAAHCRRQRRVFLCDGDALAMPVDRLLRLLSAIRDKLPWVTRVGSYASGASLARRCDAELAALRRAGLARLYVGLESGDEATLAAMGKAADVAGIVTGCRRARQAGFSVSATVLLGLAGAEGSAVHARTTGQALSAMDPDQAAALSLMLIPGTPLAERAKRGEFALLGPEGLLRELHTLLAHTTLTRGLFFANHASNHLPLRLRLPRDKAAGLAMIEAALAGDIPLRPEALRRL
jgi:radical SAM superfamily enzyme YgiQ (UPF0313 family)